MFYTYIHRRADTGEVFYIGKGKGRRCHNTYSRSAEWKRIFSECGRVVEICSYWEIEKEAHDHEIFLIRCFRDLGFKLVNIVEGGAGSSGRVLTEEQKRKLSDLKKGKTFSKEHKENISRALKGRPPSNLGRKMSEEQKQKLREINLGKKVSDEARRKMSEAKRGKSLSASHVEKIVKKNTGKKRNEEQKRAMSEAQKKRFLSADEIEKSRQRFMGERNPMFGKSTPTSVRRKISESVKAAFLAKKNLV